MRFVLQGCMLVLVAASGLCAEVLDRVAVSIGNTAITLSEIETQYRLERFLDGQDPRPDPSPQQLDEARRRLIKQKLLTLETEAEPVDVSGLDEAAGRMLDQVRHLYPDAESYASSRNLTRLTEQEVVDRLMTQVRTLRLIDRRLRPNAWVDQSEIEAYYRKVFDPDRARPDGSPPPALAEVESQIRELLLEQELDQLLDEWLKELETTHRVRFHTD